MNGKKLYFIAVGGTAMAPLAVLLSGRGYRVSGSDTALYPPMSDLVARAGIPVVAGFRAENVPADADAVVVGNAVPRTNPEVERMLELGLPYVSLPQAIRRYLLPGRHSVVVTGTHGKTTTSAVLAWLLTDTGRDPGFLVGGELKNFGAGFRDGAGPHFLLEGDEYNAAFFDRGPKFLHYEPRTLLVNNVEFDHADLYPDVAAVEEAFRRVIELVPPDGVVVGNGDDPRVRALARASRAPAVFVSLDGEGDFRVSRISVDPSGTAFSVAEPGGAAVELRSPLFGLHNVRNAAIAFAAARRLGLTAAEIAGSLPRFAGVKRRLEVIGTRGGVLYVDDFAHHPTAVFETLSAARQRWPGRRVWGLFEPRSITAGRKFFEKEYERALAAADCVVLAPVFHAGRFAPDQLIDREAVRRALSALGRRVFVPDRVEEIEPILEREARPDDVVLLMSSGDLAGLRRRVADDRRRAT
ncbi:MAG TPA: Mur ligase family protein [Thermoanaerobaculia bacterium]|nr:Mur ligase family protein [Thermoanaerobaculia bacterium]